LPLNCCTAKQDEQIAALLHHAGHSQSGEWLLVDCCVLHVVLLPLNAAAWRAGYSN
jgi:hypothetical protein